MKIGALPRVRLANLPTPLQELRNLSRTLGGPRIFVKRDDMTGLAFGGNKTRKLEYILADALRLGADYLVTGAGFHSNWCTQTVAAASKLGMKVVLIKTGPRDGYEPDEYDGNHLLQSLMGAEIKVARPENVQEVFEKTMEELKSGGHEPYLLRSAGSTPLGVVGYINAMIEITSQAVDMGVDIDYLVHATGSGGTQAGLVIGSKALNTETKIIGSTTGGRPKENQAENVKNLIEESLAFLEMSLDIVNDDIIVYDQYSGGGYGFVSESKIEAIRLAAETEGLLLDPVYSSSSMACLIDLCRKRFFNPEDVVVFLHTGGAAALFPYKAPIRACMKGEAVPWIIPPWSPLSA